MDAETIRKRLAESRVARLATVRPDGGPHIVPITYALDGDLVYFAVDAKPKRTPNLERLKNIAENPHVSVLIDHYDENWTRLWWVRLDGAARILDPGDDASHAVQLLTDRYPQYRQAPPQGPVVEISIARMTGWSAA